jgi:hypothetical protein
VFGGYPLDIFARTFDASGTPLGPEFQVSENVYDLGGYPPIATRRSGIRRSRPTPAASSWWSGSARDSRTTGRDVIGPAVSTRRARRWPARFQVSGSRRPPSYGFYWNRTPDVAVKESGEFVVVWTAIPSAIGGYRDRRAALRRGRRSRRRRVPGELAADATRTTA